MNFGVLNQAIEAARIHQPRGSLANRCVCSGLGATDESINERPVGPDSGSGKRDNGSVIKGNSICALLFQTLLNVRWDGDVREMTCVYLF